MKRYILISLCACFLFISCQDKNRHEIIGGGYGIGEVIDKKREGDWTFYSPEGHKIAKGIFKNDLEEGIWTYWFDHGVIEQVAEWKNGELNGKFKDYYKNGQLKNKGSG